MIPITKPIIGKEEKKAVMEVLNSGMLVQGQKVKEFENKFAKLCGVKNCIAVNSGTAALHTCLYILGIKKGDEVITTPFSFISSASSIVMSGADIVFSDIDEDTFNISPEEVEKKITNKTKAIIAVDLYGHPADYKKFKKIADKYNIRIIEDACQAVNAEFERKKTGSFGDVSVFSFYATKNMTCGEGGAITTDNKKYAELARIFRNHGQIEKICGYSSLGCNYIMTDIAAAIGLSQLNRIEKFTLKRIKNAKLLTKGLKDIEFITTPVIKKNVKHVFHQYTIRVDEKIRDNLVKHLHKKGIGCKVYYSKPLHLHSLFKKLGYKEGDFPVAEKLSKQVISIPVHPSVSKTDINKIVKVLSKFKD